MIDLIKNTKNDVVEVINSGVTGHQLEMTKEKANAIVIDTQKKFNKLEPEIKD